MHPRKALVIGVNYTAFPPEVSDEVTLRAGINSLRYAEADANAVGDLLKATGYEVTRRIGVQATYSAIMGTLRHESMSVGTKGLFVLHFAGHGAVDPKDGNRGYLLPVDANPANLKATAIPLEELTCQYWAFTGTTLALLDCCNSSHAATGGRGHAIPITQGRPFDVQVRHLLKCVGRFLLLSEALLNRS